jgi:hypothetical protein
MARLDAEDAEVLVRDSVPLREKKRRVEELRFGGEEKVEAGERGGEAGPRRELRCRMAVSHSVQGWVCDSPI